MDLGLGAAGIVIAVALLAFVAGLLSDEHARRVLYFIVALAATVIAVTQFDAAAFPSELSRPTFALLLPLSVAAVSGFRVLTGPGRLAWIFIGAAALGVLVALPH